VAALVLNDLVDSGTGTLRRPVQPRDLPAVVKAGLDCLAMLAGMQQGADPNGALHALLREAPEDVRTSVLHGLRSLSEWHEQNQGRR
jgi:hypothetical protein